MPTTITSDTAAIEESTFLITATFTDALGNAVTPNAGLNWTLTDKAGTVINTRLHVSITAASSIDIVLYGDDLSFQSSETGRYAKRILTIEGTYNSDEGSNLPLKDECHFSVVNLIHVRKDGLLKL